MKVGCSRTHPAKTHSDTYRYKVRSFQQTLFGICIHSFRVCWHS